MSSQDKLPNILPFSRNWADWADFIESCYVAFRKDFMTTPRPSFQGRPVRVNDSIDEGKEIIFWHLTTREHHNGGRDPDPDRAERITWIRFMIENHQAFKTWKYLESKGRLAYRWYIWAESDDFLVIMEEKTNYYQLITSFWVETWNRSKLAKKYEKREC